MVRLTLHNRGERYEVEMVQEYMATVKTWTGTRRGLEYRDVRGRHVRVSQDPLPFPLTASNDVVLSLRSSVRQVQLWATQQLPVKPDVCL